MNLPDLVKKVFPNWSENKRKQVRVFRCGRDGTIASLMYSKINYVGSAWCHVDDTFDEETGAQVALRELRKSIISEHRTREKKTWIPKIGTYYFTLMGFVRETDNNEYIPIANAQIVQWKDSPLDYYRLGAGLVFKTERAARKYARTMELKGRQAKNKIHKLP